MVILLHLSDYVLCKYFLYTLREHCLSYLKREFVLISCLNAYWLRYSAITTVPAMLSYTGRRDIGQDQTLALSTASYLLVESRE